MLPNFNEHGYLPPGIHIAEVDELVQRFGHDSELREAQVQSLQWLLPLCRAAGIVRLIINGSFVTDAIEPNDVDCVLLQGPAYNETTPEAVELEQGLPFLSIQIVREAAFDYLTASFFGSDRNGLQKGVVEVVL
jgi:hypothetical protein